MATRIPDPKLNQTEKLLEQVLVPILKDESRALFLAPAGEGEAILARLRTMISRKRKAMRLASRKVKRFRLRSTVHSETHNGVRYDAVVCWREVNSQSHMLEILEDQLGL